MNNSLDIPFWLRSLLVNGFLSGVGIMTFITIMVFFFAVWVFIEDVGYMARPAFVTDRLMHMLGLHGKLVLPLCLGFGCNVPAISGTRIIDSSRSRLLHTEISIQLPFTNW